MPQLIIRLNGTDKNPFHNMGLTQNPYPQLGKAEYRVHEDILNRLGAEPIKSVDQIRETLKDRFSPELIELCCERFKLGEYVEFAVEFKP